MCESATTDHYTNCKSCSQSVDEVVGLEIMESVYIGLLTTQQMAIFYRIYVSEPLFDGLPAILVVVW